jgi:hypothetical protein
MTFEEATAQLAVVMAELQALKQARQETATTEKKETKMTVKKNHQPVKPKADRKYVILSNSLAKWGTVPQQQADLADIITSAYNIADVVSEAELFDTITDCAEQYPSLAASVQHPTYLFAYYRGLDKKDLKHAGFIKREFLRMI